MPLALFALVIFATGFSLYSQANLDHSPAIYASPSSWDFRHMPLGSAIGWHGGLMNSLPRVASNHDSLDLSLLNSWDYRCGPLLLVPRNSLVGGSSIYCIDAWKMVKVFWDSTQEESPEPCLALCCLWRFLRQW
jgi:hypothetical protein